SDSVGRAHFQGLPVQHRPQGRPAGTRLIIASSPLQKPGLIDVGFFSSNMTKLLTALSGKRAIRLSVSYGVRLLAVLGLMFSPLAMAEAEPAFTVHGFGTLGAARTTSENVEFVRDISQPRGARTKWDGRTDSVLGLQANWRIAPELEAVVQGVSRYRYDRTFTPEIACAYLKYDPTPALSLRGGRLGTEFFMLADSRLVGYSYLTVRPPGDFFWYLPFYSIDGADALLTVSLGESVLRGKVFYGISDGSIPLADRQWKIDGSPLMGAYLE